LPRALRAEDYKKTLNFQLLQCSCVGDRYKALAKQWHPDKNLQQKKSAEKKFKEISKAYGVLSDGMYYFTFVQDAYPAFCFVFSAVEIL